MEAFKKRTFVTSRGLEIEILPVSDTLIGMALGALEKQWIAEGKLPPRPTYEVTVAGGAVEVHPHDEKSAAVTGPEALAALRAHDEAKKALDAAKEEKRVKLLLRGLNIIIPESGWQDVHRMIGVEVPDPVADPDGYWWHYISTEVLVTPDDLLRAIEAVTKASYAGVIDEDAVAAAMDNFRRSLREASTKAASDRAGEVESQPEAK